MPRTQVGQVPVHDLGAPTVEAAVLLFKVRTSEGGLLNLLFESPDATSNVTYTVQVSPDNSTWADTTAAQNLDAVADEVLIPRGKRQHDILLRAGTDNYVRVQAVGGDRFQLQIRNEEILELLNNPA